MTSHNSKSTGSTEKVDLSLESPQDDGYLTEGCIQRASSKSWLINKIGYCLTITQKLPGEQQKWTYRWKALKKLDMNPQAVFKEIQAKVG